MIELSVTDQDELDKFFEFAKYPAKDQQNGFSACLTSFFDKQEMGLKCSFKSGTKVVFKVKMSERKRKKISTELSQNESALATEAEKNMAAVR